MNKKQILLLLFSVCLSVISVVAQSTVESKAKIDSVLRNHDSYVYGDITSSNEDKALIQSMNLLAKEIQTYVKDVDSSQDELIMGLVTKEAIKITMMRGDQYRAFVYIKKSQLDSIESTLSSQSLLTERTINVPTQSEAISVEKEEKQSKEASVIPYTAEPQQKPSTAEQQTRPVMRKNQDVISEVLSISNIKELGIFLPAQLKSGRISHYDKYQSLTEPSAYYLVVCDSKNGNIIAVLSPGRDERTNLKTQQKSSINTYLNHKIIGFRLSK